MACGPIPSSPGWAHAGAPTATVPEPTLSPPLGLGEGNQPRIRISMPVLGQGELLPETKGLQRKCVPCFVQRILCT